MPSKLGLTREQLRKFLSDHQSIRAFEELQEQVLVDTPAESDSSTNIANDALALAGAAFSQLMELISDLEQVLSAPANVDDVEPEDISPAIQVGTIAAQNADEVEISGGTIDGTAIGATTPAAGTFTTLRGNSLAKVDASSPAVQSIPNSTSTTVTNWTENTDANGNFNPVTGIFTAPRAGWYLVCAEVTYASASFAAASEATVVLIKNGATQISAARKVVDAAVVAAQSTPHFSREVLLAANDTLEIRAFQSSGAAVNTAGNSNTFLTISEKP